MTNSEENLQTTTSRARYEDPHLAPSLRVLTNNNCTEFWCTDCDTFLGKVEHGGVVDTLTLTGIAIRTHTPDTEE